MEIAIVDFFMGLKNSVLDLVFSFTNFLGTEGFVFFVFMIMYWTVSKERAFRFGTIYLISVAINNILKVSSRRQRPHNMQGHGYSFPSGHSQGYSATATLIYLEAKKNNFPNSKRWKIEFVLELVIAGVLVGIGRMYFGMHYLSDVIAGLLLGIAVVSACDLVFNVISSKWKINTFKILLYSLPVMLALYFVFTFTGIINYRGIYKLYAVLGFAFGASAGYLLDKTKIKTAIEGDFSNRLKKASLGTLIMGFAYFFIKTELQNIYFVPLAYMLFGFVAVALIPNILNKTFVYKEK